MKTKCPHCGKLINPAALMGAKGGKVKSPAKTLACRINGLKGAQKTREMWKRRKEAQVVLKTPK